MAEPLILTDEIIGERKEFVPLALRTTSQAVVVVWLVYKLPANFNPQTRCRLLGLRGCN